MRLSRVGRLQKMLFLDSDGVEIVLMCKSFILLMLPCPRIAGPVLENCQGYLSSVSTSEEHE